MVRPRVLAADSAVRAAIADEQSLDVAALPARSLAVLPFTVRSADTTLNVLGIGLADLLITDLARSSQLDLVERLRIDAVLRELGFAQTASVDSSSAPRLGLLIGARRLVLGSLSIGDGDGTKLASRIGDVQTGALTETSTASASIDGVLEAEKSLAFEIFDRLGVTLAPAERALVEQRPTRSLAALLAYSRGVRAELLRDFGQAGLEYRNAIRLDPGFQAAGRKLEEVSPGGAGAGDPGVERIAALATDGVNPTAAPTVSTAADPAFRQRLTATLIFIINLP